MRLLLLARAHVQLPVHAVAVVLPVLAEAVPRHAQELAGLPLAVQALAHRVALRVHEVVALGLVRVAQHPPAKQQCV